MHRPIRSSIASANLFVPVIPRGVQVDVQVAKEDGGVPLGALVPGLVD